MKALENLSDPALFLLARLVSGARDEGRHPPLFEWLHAHLEVEMAFRLGKMDLRWEPELPEMDEDERDSARVHLAHLGEATTAMALNAEEDADEELVRVLAEVNVALIGAWEVLKAVTVPVDSWN